MDTRTLTADARVAAVETPRALRRTLSLFDLLVYGAAYITPFGVLQSLGFVWQESRGLMVLAYVLGTVCMYFTAKSYAMMSETVGNAGSVYGFARHALNPTRASSPAG